MAATIAPPDGSPPLAPLPGDRLARFSAVSRIVHWTMAVLLVVLMATAAALYLPSVATLVGRRETVKTIHVWAGLILPVPVVLGLLGSRRGPTLGSDLRRLGRWDRSDGRWLRSFGRDAAARPHKFNAGQKLFAVFAGAALLPMLMTGLVMRWFSPFPLEWRTGATFVHDWLGLALTVAVAGHIAKALSEPVAVRAMVTGWVPADWARRRRPRWYQEVRGVAVRPEPEADGAVGPSGDAAGDWRDDPVPAGDRRQGTADARTLGAVGQGGTIQDPVPGEGRPPAAGPPSSQPRLAGVLVAAGCVVLAVAGAALVARESGGGSGDLGDSPGAVAVAWEERIDRGDYRGLYDLAGSEYRQGLSPDDFEADAAAELLHIADVKGAVLGVAVAETKVAAETPDTAEVLLSLDFGEGLLVPQTVNLVREQGEWRVSAYQSILQSDVVGACLAQRVKPQCI